MWDRDFSEECLGNLGLFNAPIMEYVASSDSARTQFHLYTIYLGFFPPISKIILLPLIFLLFSVVSYFAKLRSGLLAFLEHYWLLCKSVKQFNTAFHWDDKHFPSASFPQTSSTLLTLGRPLSAIAFSHWITLSVCLKWSPVAYKQYMKEGGGRGVMNSSSVI